MQERCQKISRNNTEKKELGLNDFKSPSSNAVFVADFSYQELSSAIKDLKTRNSPGEDGILVSSSNIG